MSPLSAVLLCFLSAALAGAVVAAPTPRPEHPRPQFERATWVNLNGTWTFAYDYGRSGLERGLQNSKGFERGILVPFCPESKLSGVENRDFIPAMAYHRKLVMPAAWTGKRVFLRFGAVDYACEGFVDGKSVGKHKGGMTSFAFDVTKELADGREHDFVLYVVDDLLGGMQPRGKQSVRYESNGCDYTRTTGIWQTVWLEAVDEAGLDRCRITPDLDGRCLIFTPSFISERRGRRLRVTVTGGGKTVATKTVSAVGGTPFAISLGEEARAWSPSDPFLYDLALEVLDVDGTVVDRVKSYAGLRKIHCEGNRILLNNEPVFLRFVLDQGFYPEGVWTAPSDAALKRDIELAKAIGFNGARLHHKVFEERYHYWADRLGYLTWGEFVAANYGDWGVRNPPKKALDGFWQFMWGYFAEWRDIVERDANHPSIVAWVPANETWVGGCPLDDYRRMMSSLYDLTKSIDPTRPVNETSGFMHVKTDLWTVHGYRGDVGEFRKDILPDGGGVFMMDKQLETGYHGQPYLNDEFGGFGYFTPERQVPGGWGYSSKEFKCPHDFYARLAPQIRAMNKDGRMSGFCYTQLTDVEQEQNGLYYYDRTPKFPTEEIRKVIVEGSIP